MKEFPLDPFDNLFMRGCERVPNKKSVFNSIRQTRKPYKTLSEEKRSNLREIRKIKL